MKVMNQPVPSGFESYATKDGVFIRNVRDGNDFKWIPIRNLISNGIDSNGKISKYGRRSFGGVFNDLEDNRYKDPEAPLFEKAVKKYGGFYISTQKFASCHKSQADEYAKNYLADLTDAESLLPCGAAFDCMFEYIYERFLKYVLKHKSANETPYDAWNRIAKLEHEKLISQGIYGIKGLMDHRHEHTSEVVGTICAAYRGEFRMFLDSISHYPNEETIIDLKYVSWLIGLRNYCHMDLANFGYRIMILPK